MSEDMKVSRAHMDWALAPGSALTCLGGYRGALYLGRSWGNPPIPCALC